MMLLFASVAPVFAGQIVNTTEHAGDHTTIATYVDNANVSVENIQPVSNQHCNTSSDNGMLCAAADCGQCVCFLSVLRIPNNNVTPVLNYFFTTPLSYFDLPIKDRPPRVA